MPDSPPPIPFFKPSIDDQEIEAVVATLRSGWVTMGPRTAEFEQAFQRYCGAEHAKALNSCTAGLHLALLALGVGSEDEVVTSSLTFAATANVICHVGAKPVFAEIDPETWNITAATIEPRLTERTRAVIAVHYAGLPCDLAPIRELCTRRGIALIEDAAHAAGARYRGRPIGADADAAAFSFYANKNMTTGEGGMLTTRSQEVADAVHRMRLHGMSKDAWRRYTNTGTWRYDVVTAGFKYNTTDINAALGLVQLQKLDSFIEARAKIAAQYREALSDVAFVRFQATAHPEDTPAHHLVAVRLDSSRGAPDRERVMEHFRARNIAYSVHFQPMHLMSFYRERWGHQEGDLPVTEAISSELLSLPLYPGMTEEQINRVVDALRTVAA